jgi:cell wall-associated NlpC family hydrolase
MTRDDVVDAARKYIGSRFRWGGRDRVKGIDCVGLLVLVGREFGQEISDPQKYRQMHDTKLFLNTIRTQSLEANMRALRPGNIVLLKDGAFPFHCGIVAKRDNGLTIINSNMKLRKVVEQDAYEWRDAIIEARDFVGVV